MIIGLDGRPIHAEVTPRKNTPKPGTPARRTATCVPFTRRELKSLRASYKKYEGSRYGQSVSPYHIADLNRMLQ